MKQMSIICVLFISFIFAQNHPNSVSTSNAIARWDGEYPIVFSVFGDNYGMNSIFVSISQQLSSLDTLLDFIITTGDHTAGGDSAGYAEYISHIDSINIPWITTMGNHEINDSLGWDRFNEYFGYPDFFFDIGIARFIVLTNCYPADEVVSGTENVYYMFTSSQLDWLENLLADWDGYKFVFVHVPPYLQGHIIIGTLGSIGYSPDYDSCLTERFTNLLKDYNVYVCFCGHFHIYDRWMPENERYGDVTFIITGGAGASLTPWVYGAPSGGSFYHFLIMELYEDGTLVQHIVRPDTVDDGFTNVEYDTVYEFTFYPPSAIKSNNISSSEIDIPYPNPFNNSIKIPVMSEEKYIRIFNTSGKIVQTIPVENNRKVTWHPGNSIISGIYLINGIKILYLR